MLSFLALFLGGEEPQPARSSGTRNETSPDPGGNRGVCLNRCDAGNHAGPGGELTGRLIISDGDQRGSANGFSARLRPSRRCHRKGGGRPGSHSPRGGGGCAPRMLAASIPHPGDARGDAGPETPLLPSHLDDGSGKAMCSPFPAAPQNHPGGGGVQAVGCWSRGPREHPSAALGDWQQRPRATMGFGQGWGLHRVPRPHFVSPHPPGKAAQPRCSTRCAGAGRVAPGRESSRVIRAGGCESANDA